MTGLIRIGIRKIREKISFYRFKRNFFGKYSRSFINPMNIFDLDKVKIGRYSYGELNVMMWKNPNQGLTIGNFVSIAPNVTFILGGNHSFDTISSYPFSDFVIGNNLDEEMTKGPVIVKDDVWIGAYAIILSGVTLGQGSIIATGAVVTKDVPPYAIVAGNPAKIIKYRFDEEIISILVDRVNFSNLTEQRIRSNIGLLRTPVDKDKIEQYISLFK